MLKTGEVELGKWPLKYFPPQGGKYSGTMIVTNYRLLFFKRTHERRKMNNIELDLNKEEISSVSVKHHLTKKSVIISVKGKSHSFSKLFFNPRNFIKLIKI
jgi:hypothetical protein